MKNVHHFCTAHHFCTHSSFYGSFLLTFPASLSQLTLSKISFSTYQAKSSHPSQYWQKSSIYTPVATQFWNTWLPWMWSLTSDPASDPSPTLYFRASDHLSSFGADLMLRSASYYWHFTKYPFELTEGPNILTVPIWPSTTIFIVCLLLCNLSAFHVPDPVLKFPKNSILCIECLLMCSLLSRAGRCGAKPPEKTSAWKTRWTSVQQEVICVTVSMMRLPTTVCSLPGQARTRGWAFQIQYPQMTSPTSIQSGRRGKSCEKHDANKPRPTSQQREHRIQILLLTQTQEVPNL